MELLNLALLALLGLLARKLLWCLRWLWCYYHRRPTPQPISFFPRRSGETFEGHLRRTGEAPRRREEEVSISQSER